MPRVTTQELLQILRTDEAFREEARRLLLTDALLNLPAEVALLTATVAALAEDQRKLASTVAALAEDQRKLASTVAELVAGQHGHELALERLTHQIESLTRQVAALVASHSSMKDDLAELKGASLEEYYRRRASTALGRHLRAVDVEDLAAILEEANEKRALTDDEWQEGLALDLLVRGKSRRTGEELRLALEISWLIDRSDVERAVRRSRILDERGVRTLPAVAGKGIDPLAQERSAEERVVVVLGGSVINEGLMHQPRPAA